MSWKNDLFTQKILSGLDLDRMKDDLTKFNQWERYTGSSAGEASVDYIIEQMQKYSVSVERLHYDVYRSLPVSGKVTVVKPRSVVLDAMPVVYSGNASKLSGELVFDHISQNTAFDKRLQEDRFLAFKNKIVLTYDFNFDFYYNAARAGALGVVAIWPKEIHHHDTLGGVWGTPGKRDRDMYPWLPYVEIIDREGQILLDMLKNDAVQVLLDVEMDNNIVTSSMPIATIKGKSDKFVLLSGHYDSWHEGMTDNGAANVLMMEVARVLQKHHAKLQRSVVVAWWSGHSDARYSGSTWYCDNYYQYLRENCVAHINMDICGCMGSNAVRFDMTGMEGTGFNDNFLSQYNSGHPLPYHPLNRSSDQTFWGADIPVSIAPQFYVEDNKKKVEQTTRENPIDCPPVPPAFGVGGPFFWWHTKEDTMDKVSDSVLMRDCKIAAQLVCRYTNTKTLPVDMIAFVNEMRQYFDYLSQTLSCDFDVKPLLPVIDKLVTKIRTFAAAIADHCNTDNAVMRVAGELVRLKFTYSSPYYHDFAVDHPVYSEFTKALGQSKGNMKPAEFLFAHTDFIRQRNRMLGELTKLFDTIDCQIMMLAGK